MNDMQMCKTCINNVSSIRENNMKNIKTCQVDSSSSRLVRGVNFANLAEEYIVSFRKICTSEKWRTHMHVHKQLQRDICKNIFRETEQWGSFANYKPHEKKKPFGSIINLCCPCRL